MENYVLEQLVMILGLVGTCYFAFIIYEAMLKQSELLPNYKKVEKKEETFFVPTVNWED